MIVLLTIFAFCSFRLQQPLQEFDIDQVESDVQVWLLKAQAACESGCQSSKRCSVISMQCLSPGGNRVHRGTEEHDTL